MSLLYLNRVSSNSTAKRCSKGIKGGRVPHVKPDREVDRCFSSGSKKEYKKAVLLKYMGKASCQTKEKATF